MKPKTFITKLKDLSKRIILIGISCLLIGGLGGFTWPETLTKHLAKWPLIGKFFDQEKPPLDLRKKAQDSLEEALLAGADIYAPQQLEAAQKAFSSGEFFLNQKQFDQARKNYQKALELAQKAKETAEKKRLLLKKKCFEKYEHLQKLVKKEDLNLAFQLRYLKGLIEQEKFEEFEKEYLKLKRNIKEGDSKEPPSKSPDK